MGELVKVEDLSVGYGARGREKMAVDGLSMTVGDSGFTLGLVGESGSGKTTLGLSMMRLIERPGRITKGTISYRGHDLLQMSDEELRGFRWKEVSMVFQSAMNSLNPVVNVLDHITEVISQHELTSKAEARDRAYKLLSQVGIPTGRGRDFPHEFSGGMRQRVGIALALALSPKLLIADEPTSALDVVVQKQILSLLKDEVSKRKLSMLFVTHEIALLQELVDNVTVMFKGEIAETGPTDKVLLEPLHPYTEMLVESLLTLDSSRDTALSARAAGEKFEEHTVPAVGCKYANRCRYAFDRCRVEKPLLLESEKGRWVACHRHN